MRIGTHAVTLGSMQQQKTLDVIANNLANVSSPGFKREDVRFENFLWQSTVSKMEQGPIRATENPLDIALEGKGFLRVETDEGVRYTRAGNLTLNRDNTLVTQEGWPVLGKSGPIELPNSSCRITEDGQIFDGNESIDTLDLVQFGPETQLVRGKGGCFIPVDQNAEAVPAEECKVQQGALEGANFTIVEEMTRMIDSLRMFEAYQKIMQITDRDVDSQIINKLGS